MSSESVVRAIEAALSALSTTRPDWNDDLWLWEAIEEASLLSVPASLEAWPVTASLQGKAVSDGLGFGMSFDFRRLARWLIFRSAAVGASAAVQEVEQFVAKRATEMLTVSALAGLNLDCAVQLYPDMMLLPLADLPPCRQRSEAFGRIARPHGLRRSDGRVRYTNGSDSSATKASCR